MFLKKQKESEYKNENNISSKSTLVYFLIFLFIACIIFSISFYIFYNKMINSNTIQSGVFIKDINVSGLTKDEAIKYVNEKIDTELNDSIQLQYKTNTYYLELEQIDAKFNIDECVDYAFNIGKSGNILSNVREYIHVYFTNINITPTLTYDEDALTNYLEFVEAMLPDQVVEPDFYTDDGKLIIVNGINGAGIEMDTLKQSIIKCIDNLKTSTQCLSIPTYTKYPTSIDVDKIHEEIYTEPQNAYFTTDPYAVMSEVIGVDFDVDKIKEEINEDPLKEEYTISLIYTTPEVTVKDLGMDAFPDLLASYSTKYVNNPDRTTNLRLAASKVNGTVVMPGEVFSYNQVVGKRTTAAGYKNAAIYQDGGVTDGLGGGICQVSSTLYNAAISAGMLIEERRNHMFVPSYVSGGMDATVVWGSTDFKFSNQRAYPVKITATVSDGIVNIKIYGLKTEEIYDMYKLSIGTEVIKKTDTSLVVQSYRVYTDSNGNVVRRDKLYTDTYKVH